MSSRVFLVEDNPIIRRSLIETIEDLVAAEIIGWAATERDACAELSLLKDGWDVALVDLFLLQGSGLGVVHSLRGRGPNQKVYVVSNYAMNDMRERAGKLGADAVFDKSTELDALIDLLAVPPTPLMAPLHQIGGPALSTACDKQSMSRKGNCFDNAAIESFFGTLKAEYFHLEKPDSIDALGAGVHDYVHYYNYERIKLGLQGLSPVEYRLRSTA